MKILFVSGVAPIVTDIPAALGLYRDALGIDLRGDDYPATDGLAGVRHFGLWPLAGVANSCFGVDEWPRDTPIPTATIEFEVDDIDAAAAELAAAGHRLLRAPADEPWGQRTARLLTNDGLLLAVTHTPWMHG
jgi:catechol 2,3-dioxygenase-like lactoylglutathione lyase family enzyme